MPPKPTMPVFSAIFFSLKGVKDWKCGKDEISELYKFALFFAFTAFSRTYF
jgi:hypothetical protein